MMDTAISIMVEESKEGSDSKNSAAVQLRLKPKSKFVVILRPIDCGFHHEVV